jgi:hypothetical protein
MGPVGDYPPPQVRIENSIEHWETINKDLKYFDSKETDKAEYRGIKECIKDYFSHIKSKEIEIRSESSPIDELKEKRHNLLNKMLIEIVEKPLSVIKDLVQREIPAFKPDDSIFELIELLKNRIPPVNSTHKKGDTIETNYDIASILNAGWIFWLTHAEDISQEKKVDKNEEMFYIDKLRKIYYEPLVEVSNLILKGIELANFNKQFSDEKQKDESKGKG